MNKEKIEKAKDDLRFFNEGDYITKEMEHSADILKEYIKQLEKDKEEAYWKGYVQKQKEAEEICKMCNYRKRYRELTEKESILDKVTDKLKEVERELKMDGYDGYSKDIQEILNILDT